MALMFPRLARNFARNGYYPTDEITLERTLQALTPATSGRMRICDPAPARVLPLLKQLTSWAATRSEHSPSSTIANARITRVACSIGCCTATSSTP